MAVRHFLMMNAMGFCVPEAVEQMCLRLIDECPQHRRSTIIRGVDAWASMVQRGAGPSREPTDQDMLVTEEISLAGAPSHRS